MKTTSSSQTTSSFDASVGKAEKQALMQAIRSREDPMPSATHIPDEPVEISMHLSVHFVAICPKCNQEQPQGGYSRVALGRLLNGGHPIEAYCMGCDEFWFINRRERVAAAAELSSALECNQSQPRTKSDAGGSQSLHCSASALGR